jgi:hypothetical protein
VQIEAAAAHRSLGNVLFIMSSGRYESRAVPSSTQSTPLRSVRRHTSEDAAIDDHRHGDEALDDEDDDDDENEGTRSAGKRAALLSSVGTAGDDDDNYGGAPMTGRGTRRIVRHRDRLWRVLRCELTTPDDAGTERQAQSAGSSTPSARTPSSPAESATTHTLFKVRRGLSLQLSADSRHIVCVAGTIVKLFDTHQHMLRSFQSKIAVASVGVSPSLVDGIVAFGDVSGRISLWR